MNGDIGDYNKRNKGEVRLQSMPWYHGRINREEAEVLLKDGEDGLFLIRESVNFPGDFTLCLCNDNHVEHYRIKYEANMGQYSVDEEVFFPNLSDLVFHYSQDADGLVNKLMKPLPKSGAPVFPPVVHYFTSQGWVLNRNDLELEDRLGQGDFAEVFRAHYRGMLCAAKCVQQKSKISFVGMKEAAVMTSLSHPNLVAFYGMVVDTDRIYLLTEYMEKGSLVNYLRTRGKAEIGQTQLLKFTLDCCRGMAYLEKKELVHRDLAARNVLLDKASMAKVADFGLCREADSQESSGKVPIKWTAPEAVRHNLFTHASDMWSYGILLWEIYSFGRLPYLGISVTEVMREIESGFRLPPPTDCPQHMYVVMQKAWSIQPERRPTFDQVLVELSQVQKMVIMTPSPPPAHGQHQPPLPPFGQPRDRLV